MNIGILALHGNFAEHRVLVESMGYAVLEIRTIDQLEKIDHLIIPGGESTVISKLLKEYNLDADAVIKKVKDIL